MKRVHFGRLRSLRVGFTHLPFFARRPGSRRAIVRRAAAASESVQLNVVLRPALKLFGLAENLVTTGATFGPGPGVGAVPTVIVRVAVVTPPSRSVTVRVAVKVPAAR